MKVEKLEKNVWYEIDDFRLKFIENNRVEICAECGNKILIIPVIGNEICVKLEKS